MNISTEDSHYGENMRNTSFVVCIIFALVSLIAMIPVADAECTVTINTTPGSSGGDAALFRAVHNSTFTDLRNGPGTLVYQTRVSNYIRVTSDIEPDTFWYIARGAYWFDTGTALPDDATIVSAKIGLYRLGYAMNLGDTGVGITRYTINGSWTDDDYGNFNDERFATDILISDQPTNQYYNWSLNSLGLSNISLTGNSGFGVRLGFDIDNVSPAWRSYTYSSMHYNTSDNSPRPPFIEITYTNGTCSGAAPLAAFSADTTTGPAPLTVTFTDSSTGDPPLTYAWDFGDGSGENATLQSPVHTFADVGTYNVSLTVSNAFGSNTTNKTGYITVSAVPLTPIADFTGSPRSGYAPLTVTFTDSSTGDGLLTWAWDFGDGSGENATLQSPVHTFADVGTYNVSLTVTNGAGSNTTNKTGYITVSAPPLPPVADFSGSPQSGPAPLTVTFTDSSTGDVPLTYAWDFGDGATSNSQSPLHTYPNAGTYNVSLTVSNDFGSNTSTKTNYITALTVSGTGEWILDYGMDRVVDRRFQYGYGTDIPLAGDFNNDNITDIGVVRSGEWILDYGMDRVVDRRFQYGLATDTPLVADFNNDNITDIGVVRSGEWILDYGMNRVVDNRFPYGLATDTPLAADFNNDNITDIGVVRSGEWILDYGMNRVVDNRFPYGLAIDTPLAGDFNNDGLTDIGAVRMV